MSLSQPQASALQHLSGLIGKHQTMGRSLCCFIGPQGSGKTFLAKHICEDETFAPARRIAVNQTLIRELPEKYREILGFKPSEFQRDLRRFKKSLLADVARIIRERMVDEGLTILDHLELLFTLGIDPVTTWYNDAVGKRRVLLVFTGRMAGEQCKVGLHTLTRADQPIVELEARL